MFKVTLDIGIMVRVFSNGPGDLGSISGRVIPKTQKIVLDTSLLNTQHYKVRIKGKVEQSRERSSTLPLHLSVVAIKNGAFESPSTMVTNFTYLLSNSQPFPDKILLHPSLTCYCLESSTGKHSNHILIFFYIRFYYVPFCFLSLFLTDPCLFFLERGNFRSVALKIESWVLCLGLSHLFCLLWIVQRTLQAFSSESIFVSEI